MLCTAVVMGASLTFGSAAMARESSIALPYEQEAAWDQIALTHDDTVSTADENGAIVGFLYPGAAAWVLDRGDEWTQISSGGLTGYVKNEYIVCGADAKGLAQGHGVEGVATTWSDVKLFSGADGSSQVLDSLASGDSFILTPDEGNWLQVQNGADSTAYVSAEDVSRVLLLDTAVAVDGGASDESYSEDSYSDASYTDTYYDDSYADASYTDDSYTDTGYTDETYTDSSYTDTSYTDTSYTDTTYTDSSASTTSAGGESYYDPTTGIYYDASTGLYYDSGTGILYDAWWNPVNEAIATPMATSTASAQTDTTASAENTAATTTTAASSASADDTSLLAALIYCEAGNQSYDGMVAVGAVVMNRVNSPSFPNSISEVIYQGGQFTPASSGALASALANGVPSACYDAAVAAIGGENPIGSALYFNTGSGKGTKLGDHQFY